MNGLSVYPHHKESALFEVLKSANTSIEVKQAIDRFYDSNTQDSLLENDEIYELTIRLLVGIEQRVFTEFGQMNESGHYEVMSIVHKTTLHEVKEYMLECFLKLWTLLTNNMKDNNPNIIKQTLQYMEQEFQHTSLHSLAQKVFTTPSYLSLLFKINTGKTFIEQLTDIRITKAKLLLKSTFMKNYEVAENVGYQDARYFSQIFKKKVGLSPSGYRDSINK
jgi:two-component system response regulator YesN